MTQIKTDSLLLTPPHPLKPSPRYSVQVAERPGPVRVEAAREPVDPPPPHPTLHPLLLSPLQPSLFFPHLHTRTPVESTRVSVVRPGSPVVVRQGSTLKPSPRFSPPSPPHAQVAERPGPVRVEAPAARTPVTLALRLSLSAHTSLASHLAPPPPRFGSLSAHTSLASLARRNSLARLAPSPPRLSPA